MKEIVTTNRAPSGIGPFSQAVRANGFVFVSGQIPIDPATRRIVDGGFAVQAQRVLDNVSAILEAAGSSLDRAVRIGIFLKDMEDFAHLNEIYEKSFSSPQPARTTVEAARLPKDVLIEIEVIALAGKD